FILYRYNLSFYYNQVQFVPVFIIEKGAARSKKREYPMDWVFDFSYDLSVPEYFVTHHECGVCKIARQENLFFLMPHMCVMDYPTIEYKGGKLIRSKTLGNGDDCCNFHVVKKQ
ncbi:MAG: hypothetical protein E7186_06330, partial [Erysipelotrichaceae bacterium]|nr:hypothetical protein [Erysipelotrichaceae bacterium]